MEAMRSSETLEPPARLHGVTIQKTTIDFLLPAGKVTNNKMHNMYCPCAPRTVPRLTDIYCTSPGATAKTKRKSPPLRSLLHNPEVKNIPPSPLFTEAMQLNSASKKRNLSRSYTFVHAVLPFVLDIFMLSWFACLRVHYVSSYYSVSGSLKVFYTNKNVICSIK
jgi:hypothetical protein